MLIHGAAAAVVAVYDAVLLWAQLAAGAAAIILCAVPLCIAPGVRAVKRRVTRPSWARSRRDARILARAHRNRSSGHTEPSETHEYQEAV